METTLLVIALLIVVVLCVKFFAHNPDDLKKANEGINTGAKKAGSLWASFWAWLTKALS